MAQKITTTCLIPFYNENGRLLVTLENATQIRGIDEIICIDDGSTDNAGQQAKKAFPQIKLLRLEKNAGKTAAVKKGLGQAQGENIFLLDADCHQINLQEIEQAITFFKKHPDWDMILLKNFNDPLFFKFCRTNVVPAGLRLIRKKDLEKILSQSLTRYELEIGINDWMKQRRKKVGWLPIHYRSFFKVQKIGLAQGLQSDLRMIWQQIRYRGLVWYLWHLMTFCRQKTR